MCDLFADEPPPGRCDECSPRCRSLHHCHLATAAVTKASDDELISYLSWVCHNAPTAVDSFGRSVLHMAASCGRHKLVRWLVEVHGASVNGVDSESGMTALHRSVFYGHLNIARTLISLGASEMTIDAAGLNVYDCIHEDLPAWVGSADVRCPCHVFVWGDNTWYSVGVSRANAPRVPLMLDVFPRAGLWVCQVYMSKFHSVFVCQSGEVFTCGHGVGGRLGLGREESVLSPTQVRCVSGERCCQAAVSSEHTVLLMDSGTVWTCGLNDCYQLCQGVSASGTTIPVRLLAARSVDWSRHRPDRITGVAAARYHTVLWNAESLYCAGLNAGQMGHHKDETKDKRFLTPRKVTMIERGGCDAVKLTHVVCCDAATVAATASGSIFLLSEYRCRKITSRSHNHFLTITFSLYA